MEKIIAFSDGLYLEISLPQNNSIKFDLGVPNIGKRITPKQLRMIRAVIDDFLTQNELNG